MKLPLIIVCLGGLIGGLLATASPARAQYLDDTPAPFDSVTGYYGNLSSDLMMDSQFNNMLDMIADPSTTADPTAATPAPATAPTATTTPTPTTAPTVSRPTSAKHHGGSRTHHSSNHPAGGHHSSHHRG